MTGLRTQAPCGMRLALRVAALGPVWLGTLGSPALAQEPGRLAVRIDGGAQVTASGFRDRSTFRLFAEAGDIEVDYETAPGPALEVGGALRLAGPIGIGISVGRAQHTADARIVAQIPHPFFFDRHRRIEGTTRIARRETAVHFEARVAFAPHARVMIVALAGPSLFDLAQDLVSDVSHASEFPFDDATFTGAERARADDTAAGYHLGVDVTVYLSRHVGLGGLARFARGTVELPAEEGRLIAVDAGGLQILGGLRLRF